MKLQAETTDLIQPVTLFCGDDHERNGCLYVCVGVRVCVCVCLFVSFNAQVEIPVLCWTQVKGGLLTMPMFLYA